MPFVRVVGIALQYTSRYVKSHRWVERLTMIATVPGTPSVSEVVEALPLSSVEFCGADTHCGVVACLRWLIA